MLNIELKSSNISFFNSALLIKNIGDMVQNIALQMINKNSKEMNNFNMGMSSPNIMMNNNIPQNHINIKNVVFKEDSGQSSAMQIPYGTSISTMIEKFCTRKSVQNSNQFLFIYNNQRINPNDYTSIEVFFKDSYIPAIIVKEANDIVGG